MMTRPEYFEDWKERKIQKFRGLIDQLSWNHPHRLASVVFSGNLAYTRDERSFSTPGNVKRVYDIDFTLIPTVTRVLVDPSPWPEGQPPGTFSDDEIVLFHSPETGWFMSIENATDVFPVVGTCVKTTYAGDLVTVLSTETSDIIFNRSVGISGGGLAVSGGKGTGADDEKAAIAIFNGWDGDEFSWLPEIFPEILRLPWDDPWTAESDIYNDLFDDFITDQNTIYGGGHSGSSSLTVTFN